MPETVRQSTWLGYQAPKDPVPVLGVLVVEQGAEPLRHVNQEVEAVLPTDAPPFPTSTSDPT